MKNSKKVILISGSSSNLGKVITSYLSSQGHIVYAGYNSLMLKDSSGNSQSIKLDVTSDISVKNAISKIVKNQGRVDIVVNCAGISRSGKFENSRLEEFDLLLEVNTKGAYRVIKEVLPIMKNQGSGKIVNITSMSGLIALPNFAIYSASKFAVEGFTTSLRYEVMKDNIWVTNIEPGAIKNESGKLTKMPHKTFREKFFLARVLMPFIRTTDIAKTVLDIVNMPQPPANIMIGNDVKITHLIKKILPASMWDKLVRTLLA